MDIKGKKVLVLGGAGNIGSHIVDELVKEQAMEVVVIDNFLRGKIENLEWAKKNGNIKVIKGDIRDFELMNKSFKDADYVFHEAAIRMTLCAQDPRLCHEVMVNGTYNVFEACVKNNIKKIIFASSASVYGDTVYLPLDENHPLNSKHPYGVAKIYLEYLAKSFKATFGIDYIGLRYFNVYGPRMDTFGPYTEVMIEWLNRIDDEKPPIIYGNGKQSMDFVYVKDVARANILALKSNVDEGIYNIGTGVETTLNELFNELAKLTGSKLKPEYKNTKSAIASRKWAATKKAEKEFGFKADIFLKDGLKKLIEWRNKEKDKMGNKNILGVKIKND